MNEGPSVFGVAIRALVRTFFGLIGIILGIFAIALFFSLFSTDKEEVSPKTKAVVLFNPDGTKSSLSSTEPLILQVNLNGVIGAGNYTIDKVRNLLEESQSKPIAKGRVKAMLLNINSPGGAAFDSDAIYRLIMEYKEKYQVPVYAYTDQVLASGGYYIAVAADKIYASPVGIIGSVGVLVPTMFNVSKLLERFDIETLTISDGKYKDALNPMRPWTPEDKEYLKPMIDYFYDTFITIVSERRPALTKDKLTNETGAKVFVPPVAKELGYIDEVVSSRNDAVKALAQAANLGDNYQIVTLEQTNWVQELFKEDFTEELQLPFGAKKSIFDELSQFTPFWMLNFKVK